MGSLSAGDIQPSVVVNNRILAKVNGKTITVVDVMKKMDMLLFRDQPEMLQSPEKRYQFYMTNWQELLLDMIDRELVLQDAEERGVPVSSGDVREELEEIFGPNIVFNLEKAQLSYDDAWNMIRSDILIRRMLQYQVNAKVNPKVTPTEVRAAYDAYVRSQNLGQKWVYRMISIRGDDETKQMKAAYDIKQLFEQETHKPKQAAGVQEKSPPKSDFEQLVERYKNEGIVITVSPEFSQTRQEIADTTYQVLSSLEAGSWSEPVVQKSRSEQANVVRLYSLATKGDIQILPFVQMESRLKETITRKLIFEETQDYFIDLHKRFDVRPDEIAGQLPKNFQPFMLR
jgi:hypothetical protein